MSNRIKLLCNHAGDTCTSLTGTGTAGTDITNLIAGPRSRNHRIDTTASDMTITYDNATPWAYDFFYIARADKFLTSTALDLTLLDDDDDDDTYASVTSVSSFSSSNLLGVDQFGRGYGQDYLYLATTPKYTYGVQMKTACASSVARECSKFYAGLSYDPGVDPDLSPAPRLQYLDKGFRFTPLNSTLNFECEVRFSLTWTGLSDAKVNEFEALPNLLKWPLVIYDEDQNIFDHKVEHVLVESYQISRKNVNVSDLKVSFYRLRHYP